MKLKLEIRCYPLFFSLQGEMNPSRVNVVDQLKCFVLLLPILLKVGATPWLVF